MTIEFDRSLFIVWFYLHFISGKSIFICAANFFQFHPFEFSEHFPSFNNCFASPFIHPLHVRILILKFISYRIHYFNDTHKQTNIHYALTIVMDDKVFLMAYFFNITSVSFFFFSSFFFFQNEKKTRWMGKNRRFPSKLPHCCS